MGVQDQEVAAQVCTGPPPPGGRQAASPWAGSHRRAGTGGLPALGETVPAGGSPSPDFTNPELCPRQPSETHVPWDALLHGVPLEGCQPVTQWPWGSNVVCGRIENEILYVMTRPETLKEKNNGFEYMNICNFGMSKVGMKKITNDKLGGKLQPKKEAFLY